MGYDAGMWETFDPRDGKTVHTVPFRFIARFICHLTRKGRRLDYERKGKGWVRDFEESA